MSKKKNLAKEMKSPDAVQVELMHILDWLLKYKGPIISIVILAIGIGVGTIGYKSYKEQKANEIAEALADIDKIYQEELEKHDDAVAEISRKVAEIDRKLNPPKPATKAKEGEDEKAADKTPAPKELSKAEKDALTAEKKQLEESEETLKPDHSQSLEKYRNFYQAHTDAAAGWLAGFKIFSILVDQEKKADALVVLKEVIDRSQGHNYYQIQGRLNLIGFYEDDEKYKDAISEADELLKIADDEIKAHVLLAKARNQYLLKETESAKATIDQIIKDHGTSMEARQAKNLQILLY